MRVRRGGGGFRFGVGGAAAWARWLAKLLFGVAVTGRLTQLAQRRALSWASRLRRPRLAVWGAQAAYLGAVFEVLLFRRAYVSL
jgi:hypothetical protein